MTAKKISNLNKIPVSLEIIQRTTAYTFKVLLQPCLMGPPKAVL